MITKKQFEEAYRKHSPSKCELFYIKHISVGSLYSNVWPAIFSSIGLIIPFLVTLLGKSLCLPHYIFHIINYYYAIILAIVGIYSFLVWRKRRIRINEICVELNITKNQYEEIVKQYYYENYYPDIKDYINSIIKDT